MKVFVTGGTGFIGSYVVVELLKRGHQVTALARNPKKVSGFAGMKGLEIIDGTLYDHEVIGRGLTGKDACIHIALGWGDTAVEMLEADTKPSVFIFETAAKLGVKHLIYTSSTAAIGEFRSLMKENLDLRPNNFYGATKAATEAYLLAIANVYQIRGNIIRPGYTFGNPVVDGAFMYSDSRFRDIVRKAKGNEPIELVCGDGTQFIWAGDLAKLYVALLESTHNLSIFYGLSTEFVTWESIARYAIEYLGSKSTIMLEKNPHDSKSVFDLSAIETEFGLKFTAMERIKEHVAYLAENM
ncbi:MAG TPA: NAD(P)-dependent oxidoreductase [Bacillota bacterium]|nr:NAD(P)-dependent oxidoreductase [Bacillota bacterium]